MITQEMVGRLAGLTAHVHIELVNNEPKLVHIEYLPAKPMDLDVATSKALKDLHMGDLLSIAERCVENIHRQIGTDGFDLALRWLDALGSRRKRYGRHRKPDHFYVLVAQHRVQADEKAPRGAVRYMRRTWKADYVSDSAVHGKVNEAIKRDLLVKVNGRFQLTTKATDLLGSANKETK